MWPDFEVTSAKQRRNLSFWRRAYLLDGGFVLAILEGCGIFQVDRDSRLIWARDNGAHHAADPRPDGTIYVLTRELRLIPEVNEESLVLEDHVVVLDANGDERRP